MTPAYTLGCDSALDSIGMEKRALWPELISRSFRDVGNTRQSMPWLGFMRKRAPQELQAMEDYWRNVGDKYITDPIYNRLSPITDKLPEGRVKDWSENTLRAVSEDPVMTILPGSPVTLPAKKMIEKVLKEKFPHK